MMQQFLMSHGIPTYTDTYFTLLPQTPTQQIKIGQDMPTPVGWIYGISTNVNGSHPTDPNFPMISITDTPNLYIYFKIGTDLFMNNFCVSNYVMYNSTSNADGQWNNPKRYLDVSIPAATDLKESYYQNPQGIVSKYIGLTVHYIAMKDYHMMLNKGIMHKSLADMPAKQHAQHQQHPHQSPHK